MSHLSPFRPDAIDTTGSRTDDHRSRIEKSIKLMRNNLAECVRLEDLAKTACISPSRFSHLFKIYTGTSPCSFLSAVRIEKAKELVLKTKKPIIDICYEVGFSSVGTFTSEFTEQVGLSPTKLRCFEKLGIVTLLENAIKLYCHINSALPHKGHIAGLIEGSEERTTFVGLFHSPIPKGIPLSGSLCTTDGKFSVPYKPTRSCHLLAAAFTKPTQPLELLLPCHESTRVVSEPIDWPEYRDGDTTLRTLRLRAIEPTDPPILIALPSLIPFTTSGRTTGPNANRNK